MARGSARYAWLADGYGQASWFAIRQPDFSKAKASLWAPGTFFFSCPFWLVPCQGRISLCPFPGFFRNRDVSGEHLTIRIPAKFYVLSSRAFDFNAICIHARFFSLDPSPLPVQPMFPHSSAHRIRSRFPLKDHEPSLQSAPWSFPPRSVIHDFRLDGCGHFSQKKRPKSSSTPKIPQSRKEGTFLATTCNIWRSRGF